MLYGFLVLQAFGFSIVSGDPNSLLIEILDASPRVQQDGRLGCRTSINVYIIHSASGENTADLK